MPKLETSNLCGPKVCANCNKKFYGWGYVIEHTHQPKDILEETFCVGELCICYSCYQKYREEDGE